MKYLAKDFVFETAKNMSPDNRAEQAQAAVSVPFRAPGTIRWGAALGVIRPTLRTCRI